MGAFRWGNAQSPAYGTLSDYQFMRRHSTNAKRLERARQQWGDSLSSVDDVISVFVNYTSGVAQTQCPSLKVSYPLIAKCRQQRQVGRLKQALFMLFMTQACGMITVAFRCPI